MIFRSGSVINTIRGADRDGLTSAIEKAVKLAGAPNPSYSNPGRTLGSAPSRGQSLSQPFNWKRIVDKITAFLGLYFISLFSLDAYQAAENSPFNINRVAMPATTNAKPGQKRTGGTTQAGKKLGTIADLGGD